MGINSPGIIQNTVAAEFANTVGRIEEQVKPAEKAGSRFGSAIANGFGSVNLSMNDLVEDDSALIVDANRSVSDTYVINEDYEIRLKHELDFTFDFKNLPENVDEQKFTGIVEDILTSPKTIKKLVSNNKFQEYDNNIKKQIVMKNRRAGGI